MSAARRFKSQATLSRRLTSVACAPALPSAARHVGQLFAGGFAGVLHVQQPRGRGGQGAGDPASRRRRSGPCRRRRSALRQTPFSSFSTVGHRRTPRRPGPSCRPRAGARPGQFSSSGVPGLAHAHQLDAAAGQLALGLDEIAPVRPQRGRVGRDGQRAAEPVKPENHARGAVVRGQVFAHVRVAGRHQVPVGAARFPIRISIHAFMAARSAAIFSLAFILYRPPVGARRRARLLS